jgi:hypothetical protein
MGCGIENANSCNFIGALQTAFFKFIALSDVRKRFLSSAATQHGGVSPGQGLKKNGHRRPLSGGLLLGFLTPGAMDIQCHECQMYVWILPIHTFDIHCTESICKFGIHGTEWDIIKV